MCIMHEMSCYLNEVKFRFDIFVMEFEFHKIYGALLVNAYIFRSILDKNNFDLFVWVKLYLWHF